MQVVYASQNVTGDASWLSVERLALIFSVQSPHGFSMFRPEQNEQFLWRSFQFQHNEVVDVAQGLLHVADFAGQLRARYLRRSLPAQT